MDTEGIYILEIDKIYRTYCLETLSSTILLQVGAALSDPLRKVISSITLRYLSNLSEEERHNLHKTLIVSCEEQVYRSKENMPLVDGVPMGTYIYNAVDVLWYYAIGQVGWSKVSTIVASCYGE